MKNIDEARILRAILWFVFIIILLMGILPWITTSMIRKFEFLEMHLPSRFFFYGLSFDYVIQIFLITSGILFLIYLTKRLRSRKTINIFLLIAVILSIAALDRFLYAWRPSLWEYDADIHYKHIPNAVNNWGKQFGYKEMRTNRFGHYDDDIKVKKENNEFRILLLGDSVTMGHGVRLEEAFPNVLERRLNRIKGIHQYMVINTGVQGYTAFQELQILKESMKFSPDLIILGFCSNDITDPYWTNLNFGGVGLDYHGVDQRRSKFGNYLITRSGFGSASRFITFDRRLWTPVFSRYEKKQAIRKEIYNVRKLSSGFYTEEMQEAYKRYLKDLDKIIEYSRVMEIPLMVLILPHVFQITDKALQSPGNSLGNHLEEKGIFKIDFTKIWAKKTNKEISLLRKYFLDDGHEDHYTVEGHKVVAEEIEKALIADGLIPD